jgi:2'-5' RNA ligase
MTGALIVTALPDDASQARFDSERKLYFPAALNFIPAHITLFHALPFEEQDSVLRTLAAICRAHAPTPFETRGLLFLGQGVAYALHMPALAAVRAALAAAWQDWLTPQDRQAFRPHITVQNKVAPATARALLHELQAAYSPWHGEILGLALWRYEGGPWTPLARLRFGAGGSSEE